MKAVRGGVQISKRCYYKPGPMTLPEAIVPPRLLPKDLITSSTLLEGFENAAEWPTLVNATATDNAVQFSEGTQSITLTSVAGGNAKMDKTINLVTDGNCRIDIYWPLTATVREVTIFLASQADFSKYAQRNFSAATLHIGWNSMNIRTADWTLAGGETWANTMVRMRVQFPAAAGGEAVSIDNLRGSVSSIPVVLFTWDDGNDNILDTIYPIFAARGVKSTAYIITGFPGVVPGYMGWADIGVLNTAGWDIGNHSTDPLPLSGLTEAQVVTAVTTAQAALNAQGFTRASAHVAYPGGTYDANTLLGMATAGMLSGRIAGTYKHGNVQPRMDPYQLYGRGLDNTTTLAVAKGYVDTAVSRGEILIFYGHTLGAAAGPTQWATADFVTLLDYVLAARLPVLTISQLHTLTLSSLEYTYP